jgi:hypothetical protein
MNGWVGGWVLMTLALQGSSRAGATHKLDDPHVDVCPHDLSPQVGNCNTDAASPNVRVKHKLTCRQEGYRQQEQGCWAWVAGSTRHTVATDTVCIKCNLLSNQRMLWLHVELVPLG